SWRARRRRRLRPSGGRCSSGHCCCLGGPMDRGGGGKSAEDGAKDCAKAQALRQSGARILRPPRRLRVAGDQPAGG
ncbi:unnamed protein product, partial [Effrenium voratum]